MVVKERDTKMIQDDEEESELTPFVYSITSYGADYPVDSIVKRMNEGAIYVPSFQRGYVWNFPQACKFIESLLLGLPVPGVFLSRVEETQRLLIVDGQQRLTTLQYFYTGVFKPTGKEFSLTSVQPQFVGATYNMLPEQDRRKLDDSILHFTIVRQDEPSEDQSSIYYLFERLNTGGTPLAPQEIRACIYEGEFRDLLSDLNGISSWRSVYGKPSIRLKDQELILRFLALFFRGQEYKERPMKDFLNKFMGRNRHLTRYSHDDIENAFVPTINFIFNVIGSKAFKPRRGINAAVFDSVMVATAERLEKGPILDIIQFETHYGKLIENEEFIAVTESGTSAPESVSARLKMARQAFSDVK